MKFVASASRHVLERPSWKEATITAPADVEARASSRVVYSAEKGFPGEPDWCCFSSCGMWRIALPVYLMWDREIWRVRELERVRERERERDREIERERERERKRERGPPPPNVFDN